MEIQHWAMIALFVASAVLPGIALTRVYKKSVDESREYKSAPSVDDGSVPTIAQFNVMVSFLHRAQQRGPVVALRDALLVGAGLVMGTAASIWAVVDSVL